MDVRVGIVSTFPVIISTICRKDFKILCVTSKEKIDKEKERERKRERERERERDL